MTNELISGRSGSADHEVIRKPDTFQGVMLSQAAPEYPEAALRAGIEGKVWLKSLISTAGTVVECCIVRSSGRDDLDQAAIYAAREYIYGPAKDNHGDPVMVWVALQVIFALE